MERVKSISRILLNDPEGAITVPPSNIRSGYLEKNGFGMSTLRATHKWGLVQSQRGLGWARDGKHDEENTEGIDSDAGLHASTISAHAWRPPLVRTTLD